VTHARRSPSARNICYGVACIFTNKFIYMLEKKKITYFKGKCVLFESNFHGVEKFSLLAVAATAAAAVTKYYAVTHYI
jgi:hypothetical protein